MTGKIRDHEQQIAEFFLDFHLAQRVARFHQFTGFFHNLINHMGRVRPVKPHTRGPFLQLHRAGEGRQAGGHAIERAGLCLACALGGFDFFPIGGLLFGGFITRFVAKNMRVAGDHFIAD